MIESESNEMPTGKPKNVTNPSNNIFEDSFFDSLSEIEDGIGKVDFTRLGDDDSDSLKEILKPQPLKPKEKQEDPKKTNSFTALPTSTVKQTTNKETDMTKKQLESLGFDSEGDDPTSNQFKEIWEHMNAPDTSEYRLMVFRLEPQMIKGVKISGFLEAFHLPITIPSIIEQIGQKYGGGKFQIRIVDGTGKYVKSKMFEISGFPKLPMPDDKPKEDPEPTPAPTPTQNIKSNKGLEEDSSEEEFDEEFDFDPTPRRKLRPIEPRFSRRDRYDDPFPPIYDSPMRGSLYRGKPEENNKDIEEKILSKVDAKFDKLIDSLKDTGKKDSLFNPDVVKAFAPVVVSWLESKGSKDTTAANQFSEMNKQVVGLMQGMQDLVRATDKAKEDFAEKERKEREANRSQLLEHQQKLEERFLKQQQMAEERHQKMMFEMKQAFESKQSQAASSESLLRLEYEKMREDFRQREEKMREEARAREEKLREEQQKRDEEARKREEDRREQQRRDEDRWRQELYQRDEEARRREASFQEALRQREIDSIKESKMREMEIMEKFRSLENQKIDMQTKLLEQVYSSNINNRENQLQMDLAIAKLNSETEAKMLQAKAQMELEKLRHQTQMHMTKVKHDLDVVENRKDTDPLDSAMQDYLKRRLQIDMIKELNMDVDEDDLPNNSTSAMMKNMVGVALQKVMEVMFGGGMKLPQAVPQARPVNPSPPPVKKPVNDDTEEELEEETDADTQEDVAESETEQETESAEAADEVVEQELDPMQEIPRVASFFEYLKGAIESGNVSHTEAANEATLRLSPPIVEFLKQVEDSRMVISQLQPLLESVCGPELTTFFFQEDTVSWMNIMLKALRGEELPKSDKVESTKTTTTKKTSKKKGKATVSETTK